jgi:hypothetical protein
MGATTVEVLDRTTHYADDETVDEEIFGPAGIYSEFYVAFDWFDSMLFDGKLPDVMITMQRRSAARGYFSGERFGHRRGTEIVDEIALNPCTFANRSDKEIISTLVHEMAHEWQHHFGKPGRRGYHNKQWAAKMIEIGLMPSHTGGLGGKQTGQRVTHYIIENGSYDTKWQKLETSGFMLNYQDREERRRKEPPKLKVCYTCPGCSIHVWGKPHLRVCCATCESPML